MAQTVVEAPLEYFLDQETTRALDELLEREGFVDGSFAMRQQQVLFDAAKNSYVPPPDPSRPGERRTFWAAVDVPILETRRRMLAPDFMLALDQVAPTDKREKAYLLRKRPPPDLAVEHVSNTRGGELRIKKKTYARWGIRHYVVYDPLHEIGSKALQAFRLVEGKYVAMDVPYFPSLGIGVTIGRTDDDDEILRLCYESGELLPTGGEKAAEEKLAKYAEATRADMAEDRAEWERARAERERVRAERAEGDAKSAKAELDSLREMLRKLGVDPDAR
jgi:hypothetical protein